MATHTAGPWTAVFDGEEVVDADCDSIAQLLCYSDDRHKANARLIAAAPDLLALAYQYRDDLRHPPTSDSLTRRLAAIDAVLAKVTGE